MQGILVKYWGNQGNWGLNEGIGTKYTDILCKCINRYIHDDMPGRKQKISDISWNYALMLIICYIGIVLLEFGISLSDFK